MVACLCVCEPSITYVCLAHDLTPGRGCGLGLWLGLGLGPGLETAEHTHFLESAILHTYMILCLYGLLCVCMCVCRPPILTSNFFHYLTGAIALSSGLFPGGELDRAIAPVRK